QKAPDPVDPKVYRIWLRQPNAVGRARSRGKGERKRRTLRSFAERTDVPVRSASYACGVDAFARLPAVLPRYEERPEQAELAAAVGAALAGRRHLIAEAGTGTGKSLAYLIPALESGLRVVVATATKALQEQLLANDVPLAAAAVGREVDVAVLKGRQNYLCRKNLHGFELLGAELFAREQDAAAFTAMRPW